MADRRALIELLCGAAVLHLSTLVGSRLRRRRRVPARSGRMAAPACLAARRAARRLVYARLVETSCPNLSRSLAWGQDSFSSCIVNERECEGCAHE